MAKSLETLRRELAGAFRLAEKFGFHEGICNHFSVAVPGDDERYLINAYGLHWSEIRPHNLLLIDGEGTVLEGRGEVEATARNIHIASHRANPRHLCVLHTHMPYATSLTMIEGGRLEMAHQTACRYFGRIDYDDTFGGVALDMEEGERIAEKTVNSQHVDVMFLAHHGVVVSGASVALAFDDLYYLERACKQQVLAMSTNRPLKLIPDEMVRQTASQIAQVQEWSAEQHFEALLRTVDA